MSESTNNLPEKKKIDDIIAKKAAYALNLCTVSVSQIIDYRDAVVLEQEYEAILNNFNLEKMPKLDYSLLDILERLLDTITFFRINEKEKALLDKEYQFKMRNAMWNAVPNLSVIVSGGNPVSMVASLVSQVGIGYMNYRKEKAKNSLEYERENWTLERTAIEQMNALRRQLFATAWKLSDTYDFDDECRLTERQIRQYNDILKDADPFRRYERLSFIQNYFKVYPPFWYYLGHAASECCQELLQNDEELCEKYKNKAKKHFKNYIDIVKDLDLLREDPITCTCYLEYIDLVDNESESMINSYLQEVKRLSGGAEDILQFCAFSYLKIGAVDEAIEIIKRLVYANYNSESNTQLLSNLYISRWIKEIEPEKKENYRTEYQQLQHTVGIDEDYIVPFDFPKQTNYGVYDSATKKFYEKQRELLQKKYSSVLRLYFLNKSEEFNRLLPIWDFSNCNDSERRLLCADSQEGRTARIERARKGFAKNRDYGNVILDSDFWKKYIVFFDEILLDIERLPFVNDHEALANKVRDNYKTFAVQYVKKWQDDIVEKKEFSEIFNATTYENIQKKNLVFFFGEVARDLFCKLPQYLDKLDSESFIGAESNLRDFCISVGIDEPEVKTDGKKEDKTVCRYLNSEYYEIYNEKYEFWKNMMKDLVGIVKRAEDSFKRGDESCPVEIFVKGEFEFKNYIWNIQKKNRRHFTDTDDRDIFAVIASKEKSFTDFIFTTKCVYVVVRGSIKYSEYYRSVIREKSSKTVYGSAVFNLIKELNERLTENKFAAWTDTVYMSSLLEEAETLSNDEKKEQTILSEAEDYYEGSALSSEFKKNIDKIRQMAKEGNARAQYVMGFILNEQKCTNYQEILNYWERADLQGFLKATIILGNVYSEGIFEIPKDEKKALKYYKKAAEGGLSRAMVKYADCLQKGLGVEKNETEAFDWYKKAADNGDANAQVCVGNYYSEGKVVDTDIEKAFQWWQKAAIGGNAYAQYALGEKRFEQSLWEEAIYWLEQASLQKNVQALCLLGIIYSTHSFNTGDYRKAFECYLAAAEKGNTFAEYMVGYFLRYRIDAVESNPSQTFKWFLRAAEKDHLSASGEERDAILRARSEIYRNYFDYLDCRKDNPGLDEKVSQWCKYDADQGDEDACKSMAKFYSIGCGVPQNKEMAKYYGNRVKEIRKNLEEL